MSFLTIEHHRRSCRRPRQRRRKFLLTALLFLLPASLLVGYFAFDHYHSRVQAATGITNQMTYQGKIIDSSDDPVADGDYGFLFQIYDASSGGSVLWTESWTSTTTPGAVTISNGVFSAPLGTSTSLTDINFNSDSLYLEIRFDADNNGSFEEVFTPRKRLTASPYSFNSARLGGYVSSDFLSTTTYSAPSIGQIGSSSATTTALGNFAVTDTLKIGALTGFLKALGGYVTTALVNLTSDVTGTLGIGNGGTGTSTPAIYGQVLTWNGSTYQGTSTSTLGVAISDTTGTLSIARGGTNAITQATNGVNYFDGTSITSGSSLVFDGTKFGIGTSSPAFNLSVEGVSSLGSQAIMGYLVATSTNATSTIAGDLEIAEGNNLRVSNILGYSPINIQTDIKVAGYASTTGGLFTSGNMRVTGTSIFDGLISGTGYDLAASTTFHTLLAARKGQAGWVASLGADGKVPTSQLSPLVITDTHVVTSEAAMLALAAQTGDVAIRTDENKSYILQGNDPTVLSDWTELQTPTDAVLSVNGQRGTVTLTTSHITEGSNLYFTDTRVDTRISALKGAANGLAPLGANGKVPSSYLDMLTVNNTYVVGASTSLATLTGAVKGDVGVSTTTNKSFILAEDDPTVLANWVELLTSPSVASVNGFTGSVTLDTDDVAEGGTNFYWTQTRFDAALLGATTWGGDLFVDTGRVGININPSGTTQALEIVGNASTSGSIYAKNLYVGLTGDSTSDVIYFDRTSGGSGQQSLLWSETNSRFEVSANTYISGYASTSGGLFTQGNLHVTGNSTTTGDFAVDSIFYVRNGQVAVGTTTPFGLLSVNAPAGLPSFVVGSSSATNLIVTAGGQVGIGTAAPNNTLDIFNVSKPALGFSAATDSTYKWTIGVDNSSTGGGRFVIASSSDLGTNNRFVIDGSGRVGIGTSTPDTSLTVSPSSGGGIHVSFPATTYRDISLLANTDTLPAGAGMVTSNSSAAGGTGAGDLLLFAREAAGVNGSINFFTGSTRANRLTIDTSGNVGIGTTTPYAKLAVTNSIGGSAPLLVVASSTGAGATSTALMIDAYGNVGIGTTAPGYSLEVSNAIVSSLANGAGHPYIGIRSSGASMWYLSDNDSTNDFHLGTSLNDTKFVIDFSTGNVGIGTTTPLGLLSVNAPAGQASFVVGSSTATHFIVNSDGYVGIGTASPQGNLEVVTSSGNATAYINAPNDDDAILNLQAATTEYTQLIHDGTANIAYFRNRATDGDIYLGVTDTSLGLHYPIRIYNNSLAFNDEGLDYDMRFEGDTDANLLYLDAGNNTIGIGTSTPTSNLHIEPSGSTATMKLGRYDGTLQTSTFTINSGTNRASTISLQSGATSPWSISDTSNVSSAGLVISRADNAGIISLNPNGGDVGIGTTTPASLLNIRGSNPSLTITDTQNTSYTVGDPMGAISFVSEDTSSSISGTIRGKIALVDQNTFGSSNGLAFSTYLLGTGLTERMRIDHNGNVGIGTTTPAQKLDVYAASSDTIMRVERGADNDAAIQFINSVYSPIYAGISSAEEFGIGSSADLGSAATNWLTIETSGEVGIGTVNPSNILHAVTANGTDSYLRLQQTSQRTWTLGSPASSPDFVLRDETGTIEVLRAAYGTGRIGIGTSSPLAQFSASSTSAIGAIIDQRGTPDILQLQDAGSPVFVVRDGGNTGIGTTTPAGRLHVVDSSLTNTALLERSGATTDAVWQAARILSTKTTDMGDGFGTALTFNIQDTAGAINTIATVGAVRSGGSDTTGDFFVETYNAGTRSEKLRVTAGGNVGIGTSTPAALLDVSAGTSGTNGRILLDPSGTNRTLTLTTFNSGGTVYSGLNSTLTNTGGVAHLVLNSAGGNVGIGSTTPFAILAVENTGSGSSFRVNDIASDATPFVIDSSGNVGIGTSSPSSIFAMAKAFSSTESAITIQQTAAQASHQAINWMAYTGNSLGAIKLNSDTLSSFQTSLSFETNTGSVATEKMRILANGNIGIGTTTPFAKLSVNPVAGDSRASFVVGSSTKTNFTVMNDGRVGIGTSSPQGLLDITSVSAGSNIYLNGANASYKELYFQTGGVTHWRMGQDDDTESGSNVGGDFYLNAFGDTGSYLTSPLWIKRSTGFVGIATTTPFAQLSVQNITSSNSFAVNDVINDSTPFVIDASGNVGIQKLVPATALDVLGTASSSALVVNGTTAIRGVTYTWPTANASGVLTNNGSGTLSWGSSGGVNSGTANYLAYYDTASTVGSSAIFVSSTLSTLNVENINRSLVSGSASTTYISTGYTYPGFGNVAGTVGGTVYLAKGGDASTFLGDAAGGAGGTVYIATGGNEGGEGGAGAGGTVYLVRGGTLDAGITEAADGAVYIGNNSGALLQVSGSIVVTTGRINSVDADNAAADNTYISSGSTSAAAATTYISVGGDDGGTNGNGGTAGTVYIAKGGDSGGASGNSGNAGDVYIAGAGEAADTPGNDGDVYIGTSWSANGTTTIYGTFLLPTTYSKTVGGTNRDLYIDNTGKVGYLSSALKYKDNVEDMSDTSWLYDLHAVNFTYKSDASNTPQYGFIAEEVEQVNPDFVFYNNQGELEGVQYGALISPVINELQNLKSRLDGFAGASLRVSTSSPTGMPASGALSVIENPELTVATLKVETAAVFSGTIYVYGEAGFLSKVTFENDVIVKGKIIVDVDTAGTIMIPRNGTSTKITFEEPYEVMPRIVATLQTLTDVKYAIIDKSLESFTIAIIGEAEDDIYFDWIALAAEDREDASIIPPLPTIVIESSPLPGVSVSDIINSGGGAVLGDSESTGDATQDDAGTDTAGGTGGEAGSTGGSTDAGTGATDGSTTGDTGGTTSGTGGTTSQGGTSGSTSSTGDTGSTTGSAGGTTTGSGTSSGGTSTGDTGTTSGGSTTGGSTSGSTGGGSSTTSSGGDSGSSAGSTSAGSGSSAGDGGSGSSSSGGDGSASGA